MGSILIYNMSIILKNLQIPDFLARQGPLGGPGGESKNGDFSKLLIQLVYDPNPSMTAKFGPLWSIRSVNIAGNV